MKEEFLKIGLGCLVIGAPVLWSSVRQRRRVRMIEDTPRSKIASAPQGFVEVEGFAWPNDDKITLTISGAEAVYHEFLLQREEERGSGKNRRKDWVTVFSCAHSVPFYICDATGAALVIPDGCEFQFVDQRCDSWSNLVEAEKNRVARSIVTVEISGFPPAAGLIGGLFGAHFRVIEKLIRVGSPVYVTGDFESAPDDVMKVKERGFTRFASMVFDRDKRAYKNVSRLLDSDHDGKVSSSEALSGYAAAARTARTGVKDVTNESPFELFGTLRRSETHPLFIANDHETRLIENLGKFSAPKAMLGAVLVASGLLLILASFSAHS